MRQLGEQREQLTLAPRPRQQVARDADEVGLPFRDPLDATLNSAHAARRHAEVEVGEVRDPQAVELGRQPWDPDLADA
jgi:hypothetical protein